MLQFWLFTMLSRIDDLLQWLLLVANNSEWNLTISCTTWLYWIKTKTATDFNSLYYTKRKNYIQMMMTSRNSNLIYDKFDLFIYCILKSKCWKISMTSELLISINKGFCWDWSWGKSQGMLSGIPQKQWHSLPYGSQSGQIATFEISERAT